ncbi:transglycosylase domain-containing protein [Microtetraspora niveoalba]|uniref:transglycosylase domain-containing protein n=1 Tax=Microtetraspora niveoalba TaxID=46175 RepID=UPI001FDFBF11|nr:transglycosylase domain-containing protein [Microtetraspora niveoalba]
MAAVVGLFAVVWVMTPIPDSTQDDATAQGSVIYYRNGKTVLATQGTNRKNVPLGEVPEPVRQAVIAAENRTFYSDRGVSLSGTARALWSTVTGRQIQGGSTITQQLVRNYYSGLSQERSVERKLKEIMISLKVDRSKSKDWVLEQYLNTIYFGRGAYGIQAAAQAYFGKDTRDLTPAEGAYLAAVIQQPSRFADPKGDDLDAAKARWQAVVDGMVQTRAMTAEQAGALTFPTLAKQKAPLTRNDKNGYMVDQVIAELRRLGYSDEDINQGGLKITTTFDKKLMKLAEESVKAVLPDNTPKKVRTGLAAVDPRTGEVLAFYGGDYASNQYDNAFSAKVQAGSTFKPYTLAAALESGFGLTNRVNGNSPMRIASATIPNSGGQSYGSSIDLVQATRNSVNTAFVDLGQQVGLAKVAKAAEAAGIPESQLAQHEAAATFPLGVASVSAVQQASGFGTFAAEGVHHDAHVIRSITDADGNTRKISAPGRRAFSEDTAADTTYALQQVVRGGTGTAAQLPDRPVAGKTGTTDKSAAAWFTGYVPQLSVAVNMFRDDNKPVEVPGYGALYGGTLPTQIWKRFMSEAMDGKPVKEFPGPASYYYGGYNSYDPWGSRNDYGNGYGDRFGNGYGDRFDRGDGVTPSPNPQPSATDPRPPGEGNPGGGETTGPGRPDRPGNGGDGGPGTGDTGGGTGGGGTTEPPGNTGDTEAPPDQPVQ